MKAMIDIANENNRFVQKFHYGETNQEHCIHGIKLRWSCEKCEEFDLVQSEPHPDTMRLDWMIEREIRVVPFGKGFCLESESSNYWNYSKTPRDAIDAAMNEEKQ